ncbi:DUF819 family protein [Marinococcus halophilus]|uniref:DUF819 family protein n=1 Tax=Marinococcus halophilus TaxID=1371 RepID=UPI0009A726E5|nr:DUF819 family protein [Marinococcus halophilus]
MIESGALYISVLVATVALLVGAEKVTKSKFFKYVPTVVLIYIVAALLNTFGVFSGSEALGELNSGIRSLLLPAMIFLFLLNCNILQIIKLGPKMLLSYVVAVISIIGGFTVTYYIMQGFLDTQTWKAFAALAGSWTGGSANLVALQGILEVPENLFGYALIMDTVNYSFWVMLLFWLVPFQFAFNRFTKAKTESIDQMQYNLSLEEKETKPLTYVEIIVCLGFSMLVASLAIAVGNTLPEAGNAVNATTWTILIVTVLGVGLAVTPVARLTGTMDIGYLMLYTIIALIASNADFSNIAEVPAYIISGFMILFFHGAIMLLLAKLFRLDLFTLGIASLANIGGMASAPVLAGAFSRTLVPVGVMMALIGSFMGTVVGVTVAEILSRI